jgi:hypothetical protein
VAVGTARSWQPASRPRLLPLQPGHHYWEDTNNTAAARRGGFNPPATLPGTDAASRDALHPEPDGMRTQIGSPAAPPSGSTYVIAELDGAFTRYKEFTLEAEYRSAKGFAPRLVHAQPLLRQLRPGQLDGDDVQRRQHLHRLVEHRDGPGRQLWDFSSARCAAIGRTRSRCTVVLPAVARVVGTYIFAQSGSRGRSGTTRSTARSPRPRSRRSSTPSPPGRAARRRTRSWT